MEKYFTQIVGTGVLTEESPYMIARVHDMVLDPDTGKVVAFTVDFMDKLIITPVDIRAWIKQIVVEDEESIAPIGDVQRVRAVLTKDTSILGNRVETKSGVKLGKVFDYAIDTKFFTLTKICVAKSILGLFHLDTRIISFGDIIRVEKDKIIVKNDVLKASVKVEEVALQGAN